nr:MAG TPA: hypothetical protein [Caudoviricetes sp.]
MADIARVTSNNLVLIRKNNSNPFEKYMPYIEIDKNTGKRTWYIDGKNTNIEAPAEIPDNEQVTAFHDACMWYTMLGNGILQGVYNECQASLVNGKFYISSGMIMFGGRLIEIGKNSQVEVDCSNFGDNATFYIKLEMTINEDDAKSDVGIYATAYSSEKTDCLNGAGTYDIILFRVNGTNVSKAIPTLEPGIAQNATNLLGTGRIAGVPFNQVFEEQNGKVVGVRYATEAEVCAEARGFEGGDKNRVNENLYLPGRGVYLLQEAVLVKSRDILVRGKYSGGSSDWIPFENSNSLSRFEKAYAVLFKADNWDFTDFTPTANFLPNGGRTLEVYKNTTASIPIFSPNDSNKIEIDIPNKQVRITGRAVDASFTYKNATIRAYVFGGY